MQALMQPPRHVADVRNAPEGTPGNPVLISANAVIAAWIKADAAAAVEVTVAVPAADVAAAIAAAAADEVEPQEKIEPINIREELLKSVPLPNFSKKRP